LRARAFFADGRSAFLIPYALVKNLPNQTTELVGDGVDRLCVSEARSRRFRIAKIVPLALTTRSPLDSGRVASRGCLRQR